jgi:hypothetical protein
MSISKETLFAGYPHRQKRRCRLTATLAIVVCFVLFSFGARDRIRGLSSSVASSSTSPSTSIASSILPSPVAGSKGCTIDRDAVQRYQLQGSVKYTRRDINVRLSDKAQPLSTRMEMALLDDTPPVDLSNPDATAICPAAINVEVPFSPGSVEASHLDFAISTSADRLMDAMDAFEHWAGGNNARIFALIEPLADTRRIQRKAQALGLALHLLESGEDYEKRYSSLVTILSDNAREETKWSCIMDDDTFFPSMPRLVDMLSRYDETKPYWIGGLTESQAQMAMFGIIAYGGAGMFLSRPMLHKLQDVWGECDALNEHGDGKIAHCIYQHTSTKLTIEPRLHQLDLFADASGFFEASRSMPVSLHHWKSYFQADMVKLSAVSSICGNECLLRQWRFADGWILTNGYSVIQYSDKSTDTRVMEKTWDDLNGSTDESFISALGPLRGKDPNKISYRLEDTITEQGQVRQFYIHRSGLESSNDHILELVWHLV